MMVASNICFSQTDILRQKIDSIFRYVDKSQIPTGYLKEYGSEFLPLNWFNGILTDSNAVNDLDIFRTAYCDMVTAKLPVSAAAPQARIIQYTALLPLPQVNTQLDAVPNNTASPIAVLYSKYASLKETALTENLFTVSNQQIYDVPNRTVSPYNTNNLFVAAPIKNEFTNTVSLKLDTAYFYRNMNVTITSAFVDFKDGQGYRSLSNTPTQKTYTDSSGRKPIVLKITTSDGNTLYCNSSVIVKVTNTANRYIDTDPLQANIQVPVVPADGIGGGDYMQIRYAKNNPTRLQAQQHVRKPLIYVEGYDANNNYDIYKLISTDPLKPGEWKKLEIDYDFMNSLDDIAGYDLVFVNYNTFRSFEDNTKMLQQVIQWVNADKAIAGSTEKNVVLGVSAGGVLARYTLARMTKQIAVNSTDTRLLFTMDSPHQGANVPLGLQHFLYDLGEQKILGQKIKNNNAGLKKFIDLNTQPATAQLLKARVIDGDGTVVFNTFLNGPNSPYQQMVRFDATYNPNNIVPPYKFLAIAQGNQCGVPVTSSNINFANQDAEFAVFRFWLPPTPWTPPIYISSKWWLTSELNALPNSGTANIEYFKFERRIKLWGIGFGWKTMAENTRQNPAGYVGWDAAPGGTQSIIDRTGGGLSEGLSKVDVGSVGKIFASLKAGASLNINQDVFSFVPTTSALDATFGTNPFTVFNYLITGNLNTSTFKYQAQSKEVGSALFNINHTDFTPRNAKWIYNEMENITQTITCQDYCQNSVQILGPTEFCNTAIFTTNLPAGVISTWSFSQPGSSLSCVSCAQTSLTLASGTSEMLTVNYGCPTNSAKLFVKNKNISNFSTSGLNVFCKNQTASVSVDANAYPGLTNYVWGTVPAPWIRVTGGTGNNYIVLRAPSTSNLTFSLPVSATTSCGTTASGAHFAAVSNCTSFRISPNPGTDIVKIEEFDDKTNKLVTLSNIERIEIINKMGIVNYKQEFDKKATRSSVTISVGSFVNDVYVIKIFDGIEWKTDKLIIKH